MIRVLFVLDVVLLRSALVAALARERDIRVVGECGSGDGVAAVAQATRPNVVVIDLDGYSFSDNTVVRAVSQGSPDCCVVALASLVNRTTLRRAIEVHIRGFVSKESRVERLSETVRRVARGERVIDPATAVAAVSRAANPLTPREMEVLRLAAEGVPSSEIAARLFLTPGTVRNYLSAIVQKLGVRGRLEAIRTAERAGWLQP